MSGHHYTRADFVSALRAVGLKGGDTVFSHGNLGFFGYPAEGRMPQEVFQLVRDSFREVIGAEGTLVVPTFTYSFCKGAPFDHARSPSTCGAFTEWARQQPDAHRSRDPLFSVAALGHRAEELTENTPVECFGPGSFWERFFTTAGMICNLNFDAGSTFVHYVERVLDVPYRTNKEFAGEFLVEGRVLPGRAIFFCRDLTQPGTAAAFERFDSIARQRGHARRAQVGRGSVVGIRATAVHDLILDMLPVEPWFLTAAGEDNR